MIAKIFANEFSFVNLLHLKWRNYVIKYVINRIFFFRFSRFSRFFLLFFSFRSRWIYEKIWISNDDWLSNIWMKNLNVELNFHTCSRTCLLTNFHCENFCLMLLSNVCCFFFWIFRTISFSYNRKLIDIQCFFVEID